MQLIGQPMFDTTEEFRKDDVKAARSKFLLAQFRGAARPMFLELKKLEVDGLVKISEVFTNARHVPANVGAISGELYQKAFDTPAFYSIDVSTTKSHSELGQRHISIQFCTNGLLACKAEWPKEPRGERSFRSSLRRFNLGEFRAGSVRPTKIAKRSNRILRFVTRELRRGQPT